MVDYTNAAGYVVDEKGRRQFQDRDKANGIDGTSLIADDRNQDRNALVDLVKAAGITPSSADETQVTQAVQFFGKQAASGAVMGTPGVLADGDVAGKLLYYAANQQAPVFVYGNTIVAVVTTTALSTVLQGFLPLTGGNVTGPVNSKSILNLSADKAGDTCLFVEGGYIVNLAGAVVWVPDVTDFGTTEPINARTGDGRYIKSVPAAGSTNTRITDLWKNSDGRGVIGDGVGSDVLASLSDLPLDPSQQIQSFVVSGDNSGIVTTKFPVAFKAGTVPRVFLRINNEPNSNAWTRVAHIALDANYNEVIDNTGFTWEATYFISNGAGNSAVQFTLTVMAIGERQ